MQPWLWQGKPWQAFQTFALLFSFVFNLILVVVLLMILPQIIPTVDAVAEPLVSGLSESFVEMGDARIVRTITVDDQLAIDFDLPLVQTTVVHLTAPVPLSVPATYSLPNGGGTINGVVSLTLPQGLALPVALDLVVPVEQTIPVVLTVPVEIPMTETELAHPFGTLEALFLPLDGFVRRLPSSNGELIDRLRETTPGPLPDTAVVR